MDQINMNQPVYLQVVERVKQYPYGASRADIAADFGVQKSTAAEHLEKAVRLALLSKFYGWVSKRSRGWVYINPEDAPKAFSSPDQADESQSPDLDRDDRFRQLDNLSDLADHLDNLLELDDDELEASIFYTMTDEDGIEWRTV